MKKYATFIIAVICANFWYWSTEWRRTLDCIDNGGMEFQQESFGLSPERFDGVTFVRNYDADTLMVNIPGVPNVLGYHMSVRLSHIDSPEITSSSECDRTVAKLGKTLVYNALTSAKQINLVKVRRDKYFRLLAEVEVDGNLLHQKILDQDLAVPYEDGPKPKVDWCKRMPKPI